MRFAERELTWSSHTTGEALLNTRRVDLIDRKELATAALDENEKAFVVEIAALDSKMTTIFTAREAQITLLNLEEVLDIVPAANSHYAGVFSKNSTTQLPENIDINNHAINLEVGKQPSYGSIYRLAPVELEALKTYIKTKLASGFIRPFNTPAGAPILFVPKYDGSLCLCVKYKGLNNLTIKNRYPLPLIGESLNCFGRVKQFT